tara:strand:- start:4748 stop:5398 length:651 start_codon:yes stop_codon:yes gene_type:complete
VAELNISRGVDYYTNHVIRKKYLSEKLLVFDNFLDINDILELRNYAYNTETDPDVLYNGGYRQISFTKENYKDFIVQNIIEKISKSLSIFQNKQFNRGWFFIYENECSGVTPHADQASTNLNIWLADDNSVKDCDKNGLIIYNKEAPKDWSFEDYNKNVPKITNFLIGASKTSVKHKCNRVMIFESSKFHETNGVSMKEGLRNRRINFTLLFNDKV